MIVKDKVTVAVQTKEWGSSFGQIVAKEFMRF